MKCRFCGKSTAALFPNGGCAGCQDRQDPSVIMERFVPLEKRSVRVVTGDLKNCARCGKRMHCVDTRVSGDREIRRRYHCEHCGHRKSTIETEVWFERGAPLKPIKRMKVRT